MDGKHFPGAVETHQWSAQDYRSHDAVPYVGRLPRGFGRIYVATGFDKWGMTNGVAAARAISGQILGQQPPWAKAMGRRITGPTAAAHLAAINLKVGLGAAGGAVERAHQARRRGRRADLHAPRRAAALERLRGVVGLPAPRVAIRRRRRGAGGSGHATAEAEAA